MKHLNLLVIIIFLIGCGTTNKSKTTVLTPWQCQVSNFDGKFLYEYSNNFVSLGDMILRSKSLIKYNKEFDYSDGLFLFEDPFRTDIMVCNDSINNLLKLLFQWPSDSIHNLLDSMPTNEMTKNVDFKYKLVNTNFSAVYLGYMNHQFNQNGKIVIKQLPTYYILRFKSINAI